MNPITPVHERAVSSSATIEEGLHAAVQRVLSSPTFGRTHRLSELLRYLCEHTLSGNAQAVKESAIGHSIFGRPLNYSAADDNIVRSNIRQLRMKLEEHYQSASGVADPWRVSLPKGSYALRIERSPVACDDVEVTTPLLLPVPTLARTATPGWGWKRVLIAAGAVLLVGATTMLAIQYRSRSVAAAATLPSTLLSLLTPDPGQKVMVVGPDYGVQQYRNFTGHTVLLEDFISRRYLSRESLKRVAPDLSAQTTALFHQRYTESFFPGLIPSYARIIPPDALSAPAPETISIKDFARDHAVLISGPLGNPWVQLFDRSLNFQIEPNPTTPLVSHLTNRGPREGELATYDNYTDSSGTVICYARLAYLPGRSARTRVLLAGGPHSASTQAASQFLTRPDFLDSVRSKLHAQTLPWFEAVVETRALNNDPWTARIVAIRRVENAFSQ